MIIKDDVVQETSGSVSVLVIICIMAIILVASIIYFAVYIVNKQKNHKEVIDILSKPIWQEDTIIDVLAVDTEVKRINKLLLSETVATEYFSDYKQTTAELTDMIKVLSETQDQDIYDINLPDYRKCRDKYISLIKKMVNSKN